MPLEPGGCGTGDCELWWALSLLDDVSAASIFSSSATRVGGGGRGVCVRALSVSLSLAVVSRSRGARALTRGVEARGLRRWWAQGRILEAGEERRARECPM
jgi:hypothetical protein